MIDQFLKRLATTIASLLAATILVLAALGFLGYAAYLALLGAVSPPLAALITGVGAVVLAGLIVIVGSSLFRGGRAKPRRRDKGADGEGADAAGRMAGELGGVLAAQLGTLTRSHSGPVLAASLAAGFAVGASPRLRKVMLDLMLPR
jgi:hypothetical protein